MNYQDYYNSIAEGYEELHREEQEQKVEVILPNLSVTSTDFLLDVGCGTGLTTKPWGCRAIGLDPAIRLLNKAGEGSWVNAEAEHIPFRDDTFDIVISVTAIQNFHNIKIALSEMMRVGKDSFVFSIAVFHL